MRVALVLLALALLAVTSPAVATFPGRNGQLAFYAYSVSEESSDFVIDGTWVGIAKLPGGPRHIFARGLSPAFSPDGGRLAYAKYSNYLRPVGIWLTRPDCRWPGGASDPLACSRVRRLTRGAMDSSPAWSPDGKRIAFVRQGYLIYTVRAGGGGLRLVARGADPDWSSTGVLAFTQSPEGIALLDPSGRVRVLTATGADPSWAPAGDRLAFTAYNDESGGFALWMINADGTGLRKLWGGPRRRRTRVAHLVAGRAVDRVYQKLLRLRPIRLGREAERPRTAHARPPFAGLPVLQGSQLRLNRLAAAAPESIRRTSAKPPHSAPQTSRSS
jgi:Tol biopolymer transport system component